jgi:O-antigen/teichoic acid export membrane protein
MTQQDSEHLDPTAEIELATVKGRAVRGVVILTGRTFLLSLVSLAATGLLTVYLSPSEFGIFWIVSAIVNFLTYFSDIGLAAALIQKKEAPTEEDLRTTFLVQQILVITLIVILFLATPAISRVYNLTASGKLLLYALGASLFLSSLKTIPSILLERKLEFGKLVIPQVLENLTYNFLAVILAWKGFGITSFTVAVVLRGLVGLVAIYLFQPWLPGIAFSRRSLKSLLSFGAPYQANTLLATIKDDAMTAFLGTQLGPAGVGLLGWAQKWGQAPLRFFMDHVIKVTFPAFSRMQDRRDHLTGSLTRSIFFICFLVFPSLVGLLILAPVLVQIIPRYGKWSPALIPLGLIAINTTFAAVTTQLTNVLNAIGEIKTTFKLMIMWTVLTWVLVPVMAIKWGIVGAAGGYALVGTSSLVAIYIVRRKIKFSLVDSTFKPLAASAVMGAILLVARNHLPVSLTAVATITALGLTVYFVSIYLLVGSTLTHDVKRSLKTLFSRE